MDDLTFKFKDSGIVLNTDADSTSPFIDVERIEGLSNAAYRSTERDREGYDGGYVDAEFEKMRTIIIDGTVYGAADTIFPYLDSLKANFAPNTTPQPFYIQTPGLDERVVFCKSYGVKYDWDAALRLSTTPIQIQLMAEDPTIYSSIINTGSTGLAEAVTGRAYNKAYDYGYGDPIIGGVVTLVNSGNKDANATITIYGPIVNPTVAHDVTGNQLMFDITLDSLQWLTIDLRAHTVYLNDTANRRYTMSGRWFLLSPGSNSLRLLGEDPIGGAPDPSMVVSMRSAYR